MVAIQGTTLDTIAANGTTGGSGTVISRTVQWTVVNVTTSVGNTAVVLPSNPELGDVVEIHGPPSSGVDVFPGPPSFSDGSSSLHATNILVRMTAAGVWSPISVQ